MLAAPSSVNIQHRRRKSSIPLIEGNNCLGRNWTEREWRERDAEIADSITCASSEPAAWRLLTHGARGILRNYSTSFFLVTRFLPPIKRAEVEVVYAAVRYPDEIVDTFPLPAAERHKRILHWREDYSNALAQRDWRKSVATGTPVWVAGFAEVVRRAAIRPEYYQSFLDAMDADATPRVYETLDDLIDNYIYGSAIVVGYFLAHIYGASSPEAWERTMASSRNLGIALQLTNFLRDVAEDERRGRVYLPQDLLRAEGISQINCADPGQAQPLRRVLQHLADVAESYYRLSEADLDAFAPDCRSAIQACIRVYGKLNERISLSPKGIMHRESVPMAEKLAALPPSRYWKVPLALLGGI